MKQSQGQELIKQIRNARPIIQCITNMVSVNDCANALLAIGASPVMAHHPLEVEEIQRNCQALVCNMGAVEDYEAMRKAMQTATSLGHPIVVDPVGVAGSTFRREQCLQFMEQFHPNCIRGNYSEMEALMTGTSTGKGVDDLWKQSASHTSGSLETFADQLMQYAKQKGCILVASGATDIITDGDTITYVESGDPMMARITGSGCMSSALMAAFLCGNVQPMQAVIACAQCIGECGEVAARNTRALGGGTMSFRNLFIDALSML